MVRSNKYVRNWLLHLNCCIRGLVLSFPQVCKLSFNFYYLDLTCWLFLQLLEFDESVDTAGDESADASSEIAEVELKSENKKSDWGTFASVVLADLQWKVE